MCVYVSLSVYVFVSVCVSAVCVCACVSLFKKTRPGCWHSEKSAMVASEDICTHNTYQH